LLSLDVNGWKAAVPQIRDHYAKFGAKLPAQLETQLNTLDGSL
jgi:phosphoenolpyruvate carboxykinase (GTP)